MPTDDTATFDIDRIPELSSALGMAAPGESCGQPCSETGVYLALVAIWIGDE